MSSSKSLYFNDIYTTVVRTPVTNRTSWWPRHHRWRWFLPVTHIASTEIRLTRHVVQFTTKIRLNAPWSYRRREPTVRHESKELGSVTSHDVRINFKKKKNKTHLLSANRPRWTRGVKKNAGLEPSTGIFHSSCIIWCGEVNGTQIKLTTVNRTIRNSTQSIPRVYNSFNVCELSSSRSVAVPRNAPGSLILCDQNLSIKFRARFLNSFATKNHTIS